MNFADLADVLRSQRWPEANGRPGEGAAAAVAVVLTAGEAGAEVLLIRRARDPRDPWGGDLALPGGRWEPRDGRLVDTVLRETAEEVGVALEACGELLGPLAPVQAQARQRIVPLSVTPFVFLAPDKPPLVPNHEVDVAYFEPLAPILAGEREATRPVERAGVVMQLPAWRVREGLLWGLTHRMLQSLFARLP